MTRALTLENGRDPTQTDTYHIEGARQFEIGDRRGIRATVPGRMSHHPKDKVGLMRKRATGVFTSDMLM